MFGEAVAGISDFNRIAPPDIAVRANRLGIKNMTEHSLICLFGKRVASVKTYLLQFLMAIAVLLSYCVRDKSFEPNETNLVENTQMVVYPNGGNKLTFMDYNTLEIIKQLAINAPDSLQIHRMCLSTNRDYFVFSASSRTPPFPNYVLSYNIARDSVCSIVPTGLDSVGAPRLTASFIADRPGLVYLYSHSAGLYSIDFFTEEVNLISSEHGQSLGKHFYFTSDKTQIAILKQFGNDPAYSEIEFYTALSGLNTIQFVLNQNNQDGVQIDDLAFSENNKRAFVSIRLPQMKGIANFFGSYDLETKKLHRSILTFPLSLVPYYLAYSPKREEVYMVGAYDRFYVIDAGSLYYSVKAVIELTGKIPSPSRILVRPDEKAAFVSCTYSNFVLAIDLESRQILKTISVEAPYLMILL